MADLTDAGLLFAPHTWAGRLPTDRGLRLFVDGLLQFGELREDEREVIGATLAASGRSLEETLADASAMLSGLSAGGRRWCWRRNPTARSATSSSCRSARPRARGAGGADGQVENRVIEVRPACRPPRCRRPQLPERPAAGRTLNGLRRAVAEEMAADRGQLDELAARVVAAGLATWTDAGRGGA